MSSKKIYVVNVSVQLVVQADDEIGAVRGAKQVVKVEDHGAPVYVAEPIEVRHTGFLPRPWDGETLPFGGDGETTIAQILEGPR